MIVYGGQLIVDDHAGYLVICNYVDKTKMSAPVPADIVHQIPPQLRMIAQALGGTFGPLPEDDA